MIEKKHLINRENIIKNESVHIEKLLDFLAKYR